MQQFPMNVPFILYCIHFFYSVLTAPQQPEINDQYENTTSPGDITTNPVEKATTVEKVPTGLFEKETSDGNETTTNTPENRTTDMAVPEGLTKRFFNTITYPFVKFVAVPKVKSVLKNIGTCIVNGAMEIITYYFPAPLIPLIASAAGMVIPFEPVVMLREKMPVTSYRRAFRTALNSFLGTFDRYRLDDEEDDPYMTRRFNRRFMNHDDEKPKD